MATSATTQCIAMVTVLVMVSSGAIITVTESTIPCSEVANKLLSCVDYAQHGGELPTACCSGVKELKVEAITTEDRQTVCNCIKSLAKQIGGLNQNLLATIPGKCGVDVGYPISFSVDCSK
ncbi:hypothetical protein KFK09_015070 [Dendrobium nobile]|uniref:Non-specific lipid-transfer protein n=1 Tax=Dendrobium nobile TaxID=94219 RepID=A0A8T3B4X2_DENNO|nr:hypothetical protein KFK09_015070 [Dendrobium nobile]